MTAARLGRGCGIPEPPDAREARLALEKVLDRAEARGTAKGAATALLTLLEARGLITSEEQRTRVLGCGDAATIEAWIRRAATAATADEVLG